MSQKKRKNIRSSTTQTHKASKRFVLLITLAAAASIVLPIVLYVLVCVAMYTLDNY